jgi:hypothetical protein
MKDNLDTVDLRKIHPVRMKSKPGLRISDRIVPAFSFETRKARFFTSLTASPESFKSKVYSDLSILQNLRVYIMKFWSLRFPNGKMVSSIIQRDGFLFRLPGVFSKRKGFIIDPSSQF